MSAWVNPADITYYCEPAYPVLAAAYRRAFSPACWGGKSAATFREIFDRTRAAYAYKIDPLPVDVAANTVVHDWGNNLLSQVANGPLVETTFNSTRSWDGSSFDINNPVLHETGHAVGLPHSQTQGDVMWPNYQPNITTPSANDFAALSLIYPQTTMPTNESSDGTQITAPTTLTDATGAIWSFPGTRGEYGYDIFRDGSPVYGAQSLKLGIKNHVVYALAKTGRWWGYINSTWQEQTNDPFA